MTMTEFTPIVPEAVRVERERFATQKAVAERAYDTAQMIIDTVGTQRWLTPGEFIDLVQSEGNVPTYYAQMALGGFRSQGIVESVPGVGVRALTLGPDFEEKQPLKVSNEPNPAMPYYGTAHFDY